MEQCQTCRKKISGRADKKFCDDSCRTRYHNAKNKTLRQLFNPYHRILALNYDILNKIKKNKSCSISSAERMGFRQNYHTQVTFTGQNKITYKCYNMAYTIEENHLIIIENS